MHSLSHLDELPGIGQVEVDFQAGWSCEIVNSLCLSAKCQKNQILEQPPAVG